MDKSNQVSYLYIGSLYDSYKDREVSIKDKKIGITTTPEEREETLSRTKSPVSVTFIRLWKFSGSDSARMIEHYILHNLLSDRKTIGEWYEDDDDSIVSSVETAIQGISAISSISIEDVDLENDTSKTKIEQKQIKRSKSKELVVTINGVTFNEKNNKETFCKSLDFIGVDRALNILGESYITDSENHGFHSSQKIGEYFVNVNTSTNRKVKELETISDNIEDEIIIKLEEK